MVDKLLYNLPALFQFLIGSLKTQSPDKLTVNVGKFQFLIGSLKTLFQGLFRFPAPKFQFLIGSLKTCL